MTAVTAETDDLNQLSDDEFRMMVRQWIQANYPAEIRDPPSRLHFKDTKTWYHKLARKGWLRDVKALGGGRHIPQLRGDDKALQQL